MAVDAPAARPGFRIEKDPLGYLEVPEDAYYGVQVARAIHNFPISGMRPNPALVRAIVQVKKAAARANMATGRLPHRIGDAIVEAAEDENAPPPIPTEDEEADTLALLRDRMKRRRVTPDRSDGKRRGRTSGRHEQRRRADRAAARAGDGVAARARDGVRGSTGAARDGHATR